MPEIIIAAALKKKKLSKREFARRLGIDYKNVSRMFHEGFDPGFSALAKYAKAIGCKVRDLIKE